MGSSVKYLKNLEDLLKKKNSIYSLLVFVYANNIFLG